MSAAYRQRKHRGRVGGFTMVEVILSVIILVLLSGSLFSLLSSVLDTRHSMQDRLRRDNTLVAWDAVFRDLLHELPRQSVVLGYRESGSSASNRFGFKLEFINAPLRIGSYAEYRSDSSFYLETVEEEGGTLALQLVAYPEKSELSQRQEHPPIVLLTGVRFLEFTFYDAISDQWREEWTQNNQKPNAIRCKIELATAEKQDLIIWIPHA
jgi:hypothetical protein